ASLLGAELVIPLHLDDVVRRGRVITVLDVACIVAERDDAEWECRGCRQRRLVHRALGEAGCGSVHHDVAVCADMGEDDGRSPALHHPWAKWRDQAAPSRPRMGRTAAGLSAPGTTSRRCSAARRSRGSSLPLLGSVAMDRYERRALSRRKIAIQTLDEARRFG